jgi:hypothetical protein
MKTAFLALLCAGCIWVSNEHYTSLAGTGVVPVAPKSVRNELAGFTGTFVEEPAAAIVGERTNEIIVAVCDCHTHLFAIDLVPIDFGFLHESDGVVVRLTLPAEGAWRFEVGDLVLVSKASERVVPSRSWSVSPEIADSLSRKRGISTGALSPCYFPSNSNPPPPSVSPDETLDAGRGELYLWYETSSFTERPSALELTGILHEGEKLALPRIELLPARRWWWSVGVPYVERIDGGGPE